MGQENVLKSLKNLTKKNKDKDYFSAKEIWENMAENEKCNLNNVRFSLKKLTNWGILTRRDISGLNRSNGYSYEYKIVDIEK